MQFLGTGALVAVTVGAITLSFLLGKVVLPLMVMVLSRLASTVS